MIDEFKDTVGIATRFLDNVIDYNLERHALDTQKENIDKLQNTSSTVKKDIRSLDDDMKKDDLEQPIEESFWFR